MKKRVFLILSLVCALSAAVFAACNASEDNSGSNSAQQEVCLHTFVDGSTACKDRVCLTCGEKVKASENHTYKAVTKVAPTCVDNGYTLEKCACGATQKTNTVTKLGHDFGEYEETIVASCETVGVATAKCSRCDATDNTYTPALEHRFNDLQAVVKAATCTENGYTSKVCLDCKEELFVDYVRASGHTADTNYDVTVEPTCEEKGYDTHVCKTCGTEYVDNYVKALGHTWVDATVKTASCDSVGYKQQECTECHTFQMTDMDSQKLAHTFGTDGKCTTCGKTEDKAFILSAATAENAVVHIASDDKNGVTRYVLNNVGEREQTYITFGKEVIDTLLEKGYTGFTLRFYNPDDLLRLYVWKITGLHTEEKMANNFAPNGYSDTCIQYVSFYADNGDLSAVIKENGITMMMYHTVASGASSAYANSLGIEVEFHKPFDANDKSLWLSSTNNKSATAEYVEGEGWKVSATKAVDYDFAMSTELLAAQIASGKTKLTLTFGSAFDGVDYAGGQPVNCKIWLIPKNAETGADNWNYRVSWISGFTSNGDGTYSVEIDLTDSTYDFTLGMFFHVSYQDVTTKDIGACYIHEIVFA